MQAVFQSSFLQAMGFAIANSLWQIAIVWLICLLLNNLLRMSASAKYRLAVAAQIISFIWFITTLQFYYQQYQQAWQLSASLTHFSQNNPAIHLNNHSFASQIINGMITGEQLLPYLSIAYLLLILFLSIRWLLGYHHTQIIRKSGLVKMPVEWRLFVTKIAGQLSIKKEIKIYLSDLISTPMTIGFLKPIILIPLAGINHLTVQQLEAVILHELAHIKRYDYIVNIVLSMVDISLFFNPFTQLLSKQIKAERENSCDDWVLQFQYNATVYAEALLQIAYLQNSPRFAMAAAGKKSELLTRIKRMIEKKENRFNYRKQLLALIMVTAILSSIAWLSPVIRSRYVSKDSVVKVVTNQKAIQHFAVEPMSLTINNPLFNPAFFLSNPLKAEINRTVVSAKKEREVSSYFSEKDSLELIETIPPMIANALDMASAEIAATPLHMEKELDKLTLAENNFNKSFRMDSNTVANFFTGAVKNELAKSLQIMEKEISKVKLEMRKSQKIKVDIANDQEKMQQDIKQAMEELKKLEIENWVKNAVQISGFLLENEWQKDRIKNKTRAERIFTEKENLLKKQHAEKESLRTEREIDIEEIAIPNYLNVVNISETIDLANSVLMKIALLANDQQTHSKYLRAEKLETFIQSLQELPLKMKTTPLLFKENNRVENHNLNRRMVIQLQ